MSTMSIGEISPELAEAIRADASPADMQKFAAAPNSLVKYYWDLL